MGFVRAIRRGRVDGVNSFPSGGGLAGGVLGGCEDRRNVA